MLAQQIAETANAIGMDPLDLATIISYETGGTFNPTQKGPTTQWGQHEGFIQFGEPQQRQYGYDRANPVASQLGADGAVARYFQDRGYRPGMGLLDAYSIVNAGAPGRYGASDANNGGAPGTVADKVNNQMAGHRQNALRLMGGNWSPGTYDTGTPEANAIPPQDARANALALWDQYRPRTNALNVADFLNNRGRNALATYG